MRHTTLEDITENNVRTLSYMFSNPELTCPFCSQTYPTLSLSVINQLMQCPCGALLGANLADQIRGANSPAFKLIPKRGCC